MIQEAEARARFADLISGSDDEIELDRVALTIAQGEYAQLEPAPYLRRLDEMAAELRPRLSPEEPAERLIAELNAFLFGEEAFHGNTVDYYDPRNSYLNDVLDRRTGIPISLSVVYIELARRLRLRIEGVGLPGHFIVRCPSGSDTLLVDPFNQGAMLSHEDCAERIRQLATVVDPLVGVAHRERALLCRDSHTPRRTTPRTGGRRGGRSAPSCAARRNFSHSRR